MSWKSLLAATPLMLLALALLASNVMMLQTAPGYRGPVSDHYDGRRFFVPGAPFPNNLWNILRWQFGPAGVPWPKHVADRPAAHPPARVEGGAARVTLVGHATLLIQAEGLNILVDPVWSERASPLSRIGPKRVNAPGIAFDDLPPIDAVLITHNHYDHCDLATLRRLARAFAPKMIVPLGNERLVSKSGASHVTRLDWHETLRLSDDLAVTLAPSQHWSSRAGYDRNRALWGSYVITTRHGGKLYVAGDTGFGEGRLLRENGERYGPFRLAVLPIGAYEPRWFMAFSHLNPMEAVEAMGLLRAAEAIGYHWGTFQLTDEGRDEPARALTQALDAKGVPAERFRAFEAAESWESAAP